MLKYLVNSFIYLFYSGVIACFLVNFNLIISVIRYDRKTMVQLGGGRGLFILLRNHYLYSLYLQINFYICIFEYNKFNPNQRLFLYQPNFIRLRKVQEQQTQLILKKNLKLKYK